MIAIAQTNIVTAKTDPPLVQRLKGMLAGATSVDIAAGYLFISGFAELMDELSRPGMEKLRVLVGRIDRATLESMTRRIERSMPIESDGGHIPTRSEQREAGERSVQLAAEGVSRLAQTHKNEAAMAAMQTLAESGRLEMRTYPYGMMHAKAYLAWRDDPDFPGAAIVGSSNLTAGGLTGNTELNIRLADDADLHALQTWFDGLWAESVDITPSILVELGRSWPVAQTTPFEIYLKTLYELYGASDIPAEMAPVSPNLPELTEFQKDAVRHALSMVENHGGCFIGDVVGLGKTYIGAELVRQLQLTQPMNRQPLIIAPAGLVEMWRTINREFGLGAEIESMSMISPPAGIEFDEELGDFVEVEGEGGVDLAKKYPNAGVVLVDEVHNFRNRNTQRYQGLFHFLWGSDGSQQHPTVLLSATPQNLGPFDILNQLRLFLDDFDHSLPIEPVELPEFFRAVEHWYQYLLDLATWEGEFAQWQMAGRKGAGRTAPPPQPEQPDVPYATIEQVLNPVFIRRRRKDIREIYGDRAELHGQKIEFPEPSLDNLAYNLDHVYARAMPFDQLWDRLMHHSGARYRAVDYLTEAAKDGHEYRPLMRASTRVEVLVRILLLKRLESSVAAFRSTLTVLANSNRNFKDSLLAGFVPIGKTATGILAGESFSPDELLERLSEEEQRRGGRGRRATLVNPVGDFDVDRWIVDLDADHRILTEILESLDRLSPADDDKLRALRDFLNRPEVTAGKVLIFSEAASTIDYLCESLNPGDADTSIARISGTNRDQLLAIVRRFAPEANPHPGSSAGAPIRVLLTTDVLSEGQNLQDCNRVVNYDLHWNPVRLVQRFGRVDRIGTRHKEIFLHNMWPDLDVDKGLNLTQTIGRRVQMFHDFIGLDNALLSPSERINTEAVFGIYTGAKELIEEESGQLDEVSAFQRGVGLLQRIQLEQPELFERILRLPDGIRSARGAQKKESSFETRLVKDLPGERVQAMLGTVRDLEGVETPMDAPRPGETVVFLKTRELTLLYAVDADLKPRRITPNQLLGAVQCEEPEERRLLPEGTNERVMAAFEAARHEIAGRLGKAAMPKTHERSRRFVRKHLNVLREAARKEEDAERLRLVETLQRVFVQGQFPDEAGRQLDVLRKASADPDRVLVVLERLRARFRLNPTEDTSDQTDDIEVLRIVCSEGLE